MDCPLATGTHCPGRSCPFWLHGDCLISEIDLRGRPGVAAWLDDLRHQLAADDLGGRASRPHDFHTALASGKE